MTDLESKPNSNKPTMSVKVHAPFQIYFEGDAYSISAVNSVGPFDVLPKHHNFLSILESCTLSIQATDGDKKFHISRGLMHVKADRVVVFVDI